MEAWAIVEDGLTCEVYESRPEALEGLIEWSQITDDNCVIVAIKAEWRVNDSGKPFLFPLPIDWPINKS